MEGGRSEPEQGTDLVLSGAGPVVACLETILVLTAAGRVAR